MLKDGSEKLKLSCIVGLRTIFEKESDLVVKAYDNGYDFGELINAVKDADPEIVLAGIELWHSFIMIEKNSFSNEYR